MKQKVVEAELSPSPPSQPAPAERPGLPKERRRRHRSASSSSVAPSGQPWWKVWGGKEGWGSCNRLEVNAAFQECYEKKKKSFRSRRISEMKRSSQPASGNRGEDGFDPQHFTLSDDRLMGKTPLWMRLRSSPLGLNFSLGAARLSQAAGHQHTDLPPDLHGQSPILPSCSQFPHTLLPGFPPVPAHPATPLSPPALPGLFPSESRPRPTPSRHISPQKTRRRRARPSRPHRA